MSTIFYDHLLNMHELDALVKKHVKKESDRVEIYKQIDEIVHHRVIGCILDRLPKKDHKEFLTKLTEAPHDRSLIAYLFGRIGEDVEAFIRAEAYLLGHELLELIKPVEVDDEESSDTN
jgi:hypothetical protein